MAIYALEVFLPQVYWKGVFSYFVLYQTFVLCQTPVSSIFVCTKILSFVLSGHEMWSWNALITNVFLLYIYIYIYIYMKILQSLLSPATYPSSSHFPIFESLDSKISSIFQTLQQSHHPIHLFNTFLFESQEHINNSLHFS